MSDQPKCFNCGSTAKEAKYIQEFTRLRSDEKDHVCSNCLPIEFQTKKPWKLPEDLQKQLLMAGNKSLGS